MQMVVSIIVQHCNRIEYHISNTIFIIESMYLNIQPIIIKIKQTNSIQNTTGHKARPLELINMNS